MPLQFIRMIPLLLLLVVAAVLASGVFSPDYREGRMRGKKPESFSIDRLDAQGQKMTHHSWEGQVVVVNVFASWCEPCHAEHPLIMSLAQSGKVNVYGIAWKDKTDNLIKWLQKDGNPYQMIGFDEFGRTTIAMGLTGIPETFVIGKDGKIHYHHVSALRPEDLNIILPLIDRLQKADANGIIPKK